MMLAGPISSAHRRAAAAVLAAFALLAALYSVVTPIWEAPDEYGHFYYALELARDGRLPAQETNGPGEAHQPPGYYALMALPMLLADLNDKTGDFRFNRFLENAGMGGADKNFSLHGSAETFPWRGYALAFHLARLASVALATATIALTLALGWRVFPRQPLVGLLGAAIAGFNPQFAFISGALNNDTLLALASTGALWAGLRALEQPARLRGWAITGAWLAVGALAKLSIVSIMAWVGLLIVWSAWRARSARLALRAGAVIAVILVIALGGWLWRNQMLYGDPLGYAEFSRIFAWAFRKQPFAASDIWPLFTYTFGSFWGLFGWINIPAPGWFFALITAMLAVAGVGIGRALRRGQAATARRAELIWLGLAVLIHIVYFVANAIRMDYTWHQGRYLFPVIAPLALALAAGLLALFPARQRAIATAGVGGALATLALVLLFGVLRPAYAFGFSPTWSLWLAPNRVQSDFGGMLGLRGYETRVSDGRVRLTLFWQAIRAPDFDYSTFAHLVDASGQVRAQADQGPGKNVDYTPAKWQPEDVVIDRREITLPPDAHGDFQINIGAYNYATGARLSVTGATGAPAGDFVALPGKVRVP